jgi:AcrR family transcriptional regulator
MGRRGGELREHILRAAKDVFLEMGYERASMDAVAARAETSKRSLYAHFESKENLFAAVVELVSNLYLVRLGTPDDDGDDPVDAVTRYCARFLQLTLWQPALRTFRLYVAEAERLPDAAAEYYDAIFAAAQARLAAYLDEQFDVAPRTGHDVAGELLGNAVYPRLFAALFGVEPALPTKPEGFEIVPDLDLAPIRGAVDALLAAPRH